MRARWIAALSIVVLAEVVFTGGCANFAQQQQSPEDLCALAANAFYCQTSIVPQDPTLNSYGYNGYCMVGTGNGTIGYSGVTGNGGATYVVPTSEQAWQACGATPRYPRGACNSVVRCTHK